MGCLAGHGGQLSGHGGQKMLSLKTNLGKIADHFSRRLLSSLVRFVKCSSFEQALVWEVEETSFVVFLVSMTLLGQAEYEVKCPLAKTCSYIPSVNAPFSGNLTVSFQENTESHKLATVHQSKPIYFLD